MVLYGMLTIDTNLVERFMLCGIDDWSGLALCHDYEDLMVLEKIVSIILGGHGR